MIWGTDTIDEIVGSAPGLTGAMKAEYESVAYMAGETVSCSSTSVPQPRFNWKDAAFQLNFK